MKQTFRTFIQLTFGSCFLMGLSVAGAGQETFPATAPDSVSMALLLDSIRHTGSDPQTSLSLIRKYETLAARYPDIPHNLERALLYKGYRYNGIAWRNNKTDFEKALRYLDSADVVFDAIDNENGKWLNVYGLGCIRKNQGQNEVALTHFDEYLRHYTNPPDTAYMANVQYQRGVVLQQMGRIDQSTQAFLHATRLDEALGRTQSVANTYNSIANGFKTARRYDQAAEYYARAMRVYQDDGQLNGMALVAINHANMLADQGDHAAARTLYTRAQKWSGDIENAHLLSHSYENMGNSYTATGQLDSAEYFLDQAYEMRKSFGSDRELYLIELKLGRLAQKRGDATQAIRRIASALDKAIALKETGKAAEAAKSLASLYAAQGQHRKAYDHMSLFSELQDSVINRDISTAIADMNTEYETELKEREIDLLTKQNELSQNLAAQSRLIAWIVGAALLFLSLLTLRIYRDRQKIGKLNQSLQSKNETISRALDEKNILLKEIHHRVKNNLQVISSLLGIQSRKVTDKEAHAALNEGRSRVNSMSLIHQDLYRRDNVSGVHMAEYFDKLVSSLFNTYNISKDQILLKTEIDPLVLDVDTVIPLGLVVNELISNALKYAFPDGKGTIHVRLRKESDGLHLEVSDDGIGMDHPETVLKQESFGYDLIKALVDKLDGSLHISVEDGTTIRAVLKSFKTAA